MSNDDTIYTIADCLQMHGDEAKFTNLVRGRLVRRNPRGMLSSLVMSYTGYLGLWFGTP